FLNRHPLFDSTQLADADSEIDDESIFGDDRSGMLDEDTSTFVDPLEMVYIDPNGMKIPLLDDKPIEIKEEFIYPVESYRDEWEGDLYFQILLDFSGEVIDYILKIRSGDEYIDKEAEKTVASMIFDPLILREDQQGSWLVYKFKVRKPEHLR
ncbi:MAG: energy transducer TonB, partial [Candidatus Zixiibacteriota bacterium]